VDLLFFIKVFIITVMLNSNNLILIYWRDFMYYYEINSANKIRDRLIIVFLSFSFFVIAGGIVMIILGVVGDVLRCLA